MPVLDLPTLLLVSILMVLRHINARIPFYEHLFVGLPFWRAPSRTDVDDVLAASTLAAVDTRMRDVFAEARAFIWEPLFTSTAMPARLPLNRMAWLESLANLASVCVIGAVVSASIGFVECARDRPAWIVDALLLTVLGSAVAHLARVHIDLPWQSVECIAGRYLGVFAGLASALLLVYTYMSNPKTTFIHLGAPLRSALEGVDYSGAPWLVAPQAALATLTLGVALVVGVCAIIFVQPALRVGQFYSESLAAAVRGPRPKFMRTILRMWFYTPLLLALSWVRAFGADSILPQDAILCVHGDLSRDCRSHFPDAPHEGGASWAALLPVGLLSMIVPDFSAAVAAGTWVSESSLLRLQAAGVLAMAVVQLLLLRPQVKVALSTSSESQQQVIRRAYNTGPLLAATAAAVPVMSAVQRGARAAGLTPQPPSLVSNFTPAAVDDLIASCDRQACDALSMAPMAAVQLLAIPAIFSSLAALLVRRGGLGGIGMCSAVRAMAGVAPPGLSMVATTRGAVDAITVMRAVLARALGGGIGDEVVDLAQHLGDSFLEPSFWRPVLSLVLACLLAVYALELELSLFYWRVTDNDSHDNAEAARKGGVAGGVPMPTPQSSSVGAETTTKKGK